MHKPVECVKSVNFLSYTIRQVLAFLQWDQKYIMMHFVWPSEDNKIDLDGCLVKENVKHVQSEYLKWKNLRLLTEGL